MYLKCLFLAPGLEGRVGRDATPKTPENTQKSKILTFQDPPWGPRRVLGAYKGNPEVQYMNFPQNIPKMLVLAPDLEGRVGRGLTPKTPKNTQKSKILIFSDPPWASLGP